MATRPTSNLSKEDVVAVENSMEDGEPEISPEQYRLDKQTVRRLDLMLLPLVMVIYLLAYLDRANIGNARVVSYLGSPMSSTPLIPRVPPRPDLPRTSA